MATEAGEKIEIIKFQGNGKYVAMLVKYTDDCNITYRLAIGSLKNVELISESEEYEVGPIFMIGPRFCKLVFTLDKTKENNQLFMIDINGPEEYETAIKILENML